MKFNHFLEQKFKNNFIEVVQPNDIVSDFDSLYGLENAKETLQDIVRYFKRTAPAPAPYSSYGIYGPPGTRKASLVFATAKAANLPVISLNTSIFTSLKESDIRKKMQLLFSVATKLKKEYKGCIIVFENIHQVEEMVNENTFYLNLIKEFRGTRNIILFALSSLEAWAVPTFVFEEGLFDCVISIDYPDLATREKIFEACIKKHKLSLDPNVSINRLAKDTYGETYRTIDHIVKEAHLYSVRNGLKEVNQLAFSETIMKLSSGEKNVKMTEEERAHTAYHEAGHGIAAYFSELGYLLNRIEISPRSQGSLGLTVSDADEAKHTYYRKDYENRIIMCLGGLVAEELIYGKHSSGVSADLAMATAHASNIIRAFGMDESFGPMVVLSEITDSAKTKATADELISQLLKDLLEKTRALMRDKRPYLEALANALIEKEVVLGNEIEEIFKEVSSKKPTNDPSEDGETSPSDDKTFYCHSH